MLIFSFPPVLASENRKFLNRIHVSPFWPSNSHLFSNKSQVVRICISIFSFITFIIVYGNNLVSNSYFFQSCVCEEGGKELEGNK